MGKQLISITQERDELLNENAELDDEIDTLNRQIKSLSEFLEEGVQPDDVSTMAEKNKLAYELKEVKTERDLIAKQLENLQIQNQELQKHGNDDNSDQIGILETELKNLNSEMDKLVRENDKLENERMLYWFFSGAFVFIFGMVVGRLFNRKKSKFGY